MLHQHEPMKYDELFKKSSVTKEIRAQYTLYLNARFPTGILLDKFQDKTKNQPLDLQNVTLANLIQGAYPVLEYDSKGKPIDNRNQAYIDTVDNFTIYANENQGKLSHDQIEIECATKVYAALSGLENQKARMKKNIKTLKKELEGEQRQSAINKELQTFAAYCEELQRSLENHKKILKRGERAASLFGKMINALEDLVNYIHSKRTSPKEGHSKKLQLK